MTNRSNHMPTLTRMDRMKTINMLVRIFLNQKNCGTITLQVTMVQKAHQYGAGWMCISGPRMNGSAARLWKNRNCS